MKKSVNYVLAVLIFIITMLLFNGGGIILAVGAYVGAAMAGGSAGVDGAYDFLLNNLNLYSCLIYLIQGSYLHFGIILLLLSVREPQHL